MEPPKDLKVSRESSTHYDFLDGIRALLALYVVAHHTFITVHDHNAKGLSHWFGIFSFDTFAVDFFIILSGFCLALPVLSGFKLKKGLGNFLQRRAWRILPPYYFALLFSLILIGLFINKKTGVRWDASLPVTFHSLITHLFLINNFFAADFHKINYVFWSIAVEWQIYFVFPLLLLSWRLIGTVYTALAAVSLSLLMEYGLIRHFAANPHIYFIGFFALGMLAAWISFSSNPAAARFKKLPWRLIALASLVAALLLFDKHDLAADLMFSFFGASVLIIASLHPAGRLHRLLKFKPLVAVGSFSYSLYLIHAPLLQLLWQYPFSPLQARPNLVCMSLLFLGIPIIVFISYLFFLCFERPFLQRRNRSPVTPEKDGSDRPVQERPPVLLAPSPTLEG
jgi:peptidoglycan/LPS O-acetylase OafA/YrhL